MPRLNYDKVLKENGKLHYTSVLALTDNQAKGLKRYCKKYSTPSGNDDKNHFFIYSGPYAYHVDVVRTKYSGAFARIKKYCPPLR